MIRLLSLACEGAAVKVRHSIQVSTRHENFLNILPPMLDVNQVGV